MSDKKAETAEQEGAPEGAEGASASSSGRFNVKKILLFGVLPLVVLLALGIGAWSMGYVDKLLGHGPDCAGVKEGDAGYEACAELASATAEGMTPGFFVDVPDLIVNLNATGKQQHFLKVSLKIELEGPELEKPFMEVLPRVIDQFQTYLRELRMEDLRGSSGLYRMKIELLNRVKAAAPGIKVRDILFQEMLVQ